ncbi:MAG: hypothetical protein ACRDQ5_02065, partial [Sciscionella sp.]
WNLITIIGRDRCPSDTPGSDHMLIKRLPRTLLGPPERVLNNLPDISAQYAGCNTVISSAPSGTIV